MSEWVTTASRGERRTLLLSKSEGKWVSYLNASIFSLKFENVHQWEGINIEEKKIRWSSWGIRKEM